MLRNLWDLMKLEWTSRTDRYRTVHCNKNERLNGTEDSIQLIAICQDPGIFFGVMLTDTEFTHKLTSDVQELF